MNQSDTDRIEKRIELRASVARVWRALTDYREFGAWFRVALEGPFEVGKTTRGQITYPGYEHMTMEVQVHEMIPEERFSYYWHPYSGDPNTNYAQEQSTLVEFVLKPTPVGTLLVLSESGFDAIPPERRAEAFRMNDQGWTEQMTNIQKHVEEHATF